MWWAYGREPEQDGERQSPDLRLSLEDKHSFVGFHTLISIKFFPARAQVLVLDQVDRLTQSINILHALGWRSDWKGDAEAQGINPWATEVIKVRHYEHGQVQYPNYRGSICVTERPYNEEPWRCSSDIQMLFCRAAGYMFVWYGLKKSLFIVNLKVLSIKIWCRCYHLLIANHLTILKIRQKWYCLWHIVQL